MNQKGYIRFASFMRFLLISTMLFFATSCGPYFHNKSDGGLLKIDYIRYELDVDHALRDIAMRLENIRRVIWN